jgi:AcrR family transcriptional regulator
MGRPVLHSASKILDGTRTLVLDDGVAAATIGAIAAASGAPSGSIYHRFGSRDALMAELWIRAVRRSQDIFLAALGSADQPVAAAVAAGLSIFDFAAAAPEDARLLVSARRDDLVRAGLPPGLTRRLRELNQPLERAIGRLAREVYGADTAAARQLVALAAVDVPYGAVRRYLIAGRPPPGELRPHVERAIRAVLDEDPPT